MESRVGLVVTVVSRQAKVWIALWTVYIVWINGIFSGNTVKMLVSTDGGGSFSLATPAATGITGAGVLPRPHIWPNLPGGIFRLVTVPTACVFGQREIGRAHV